MWDSSQRLDAWPLAASLRKTYDKFKPQVVLTTDQKCCFFFLMNSCWFDTFFFQLIDWDHTIHVGGLVRCFWEQCIMGYYLFITIIDWIVRRLVNQTRRFFAHAPKIYRANRTLCSPCHFLCMYFCYLSMSVMFVYRSFSKGPITFNQTRPLHVWNSYHSYLAFTIDLSHSRR